MPAQLVRNLDAVIAEANDSGLINFTKIDYSQRVIQDI